jgi:4-hydroxy-3-methylbut-2-enyl diphosphate reductase
VEKVWKRSGELGKRGFTVVVHGKATHEETRATFSHSVESAPTVVVLDLAEARFLADVILGRKSKSEFAGRFGGKCSDGFDPDRDLDRIGVVNQTTMLAAETREITNVLRQALREKFGEDELNRHFADTSDTLCYATNENQNATYALTERGGDLALVVGGYNSSNTSHIVELCEKSMPTYFIQGEEEILSRGRIRHFSLDDRKLTVTDGWIPPRRPLRVVLTSGASCPDALLDGVLLKVLSFFTDTRAIEEVLEPYPVSSP